MKKKRTPQEQDEILAAKIYAALFFIILFTAILTSFFYQLFSELCDIF